MISEVYQLQAQICKGLSHPVRVQLIELLSGGMTRFSDLQQATGISKSNLSQHLSQMTAVGLVCQQREGQSLKLCLSSEKVAQACALMREVLLEYLQRQQTQLQQFQEAAANPTAVHTANPHI